MTEKMRGMEDGLDSKKKENEEINSLVMDLKSSQNKKERKKLLDKLWFKLKPKVSLDIRSLLFKYKNLLDRYRPGTKEEDLEGEAYEKLTKFNYDQWDNAQNFYNYFSTAIRNDFTSNYLRKFKVTKKAHNQLKEESRLLFEYGEKTISPEDNVAVNEIKGSLVGWVKSGKLEVIEGMVLILRFGLGESLMKEFISNFKESADKLKNKIIPQIFQNINLKHADYDLEMTLEGISNLGGIPGQETAVQRIEKSAISKIKNELKISI